METAQKDYILENLTELAQHTECTKILVEHLMSSRLLDTEDESNLENLSSPQDKSEYICKAITDKVTTNVFDKLISSLEKSSQFEAAMMLQKEIRNEEIKSATERAMIKAISTSMNLMKMSNAKKMEENNNSSEEQKPPDYKHLWWMANNSKDKEIFDNLVNIGLTDMNRTDENGRSLLHILAQTGDISALEYFISKGADVNAKDAQGNTPLHMVIATKQHFQEKLNLLMKHGADINAMDNKDLNPLAYAIHLGRSRDEIHFIAELGGDWKIRNSQGLSLLHIAVQAGNIDAVDYLLSLGADVNWKDNSGNTPLQVLPAANQNFIEILQLLLQHGADINAVDENHVSVIFMAAIWGASTKRLEYLVDLGCNWESKSNKNDSVLHAAVQGRNIDAIKYFVSLGADINARNLVMSTPLFSLLSSSEDFMSVLDVLIEHGADINAIDKKGNNFLFHSVLVGRSIDELKHLVAAGIDWRAIYQDGTTILHAAVATENLLAVKYFISLGAKIDGRNKSQAAPAHYLQYVNGDLREMASFLVENGADINAVDIKGFTPIYGILTRPNRSVQDLEHLVKLGADWKHIGANGVSLLHLAAQVENLEAMKYFIKLGSEVNLKNKRGNTPLHYVAQSEHIFSAALKFLSDHGADMNSIGEKGNTPIFHAAMKDRPVKEIHQMVLLGCNWQIKNDSNNSICHIAAANGSVDILKYFIGLGANVKEVNAKGATPLHASLCATKNVSEIIKLLVKNGVDINATDKDGDTILMLATLGRKSTYDLQTILDLGGNLKIENAAGHTAVHFAILEGYPELLKLFISRGVDVNEKDDRGFFLLNYAAYAKRTYSEMLAVLLEANPQINAVDCNGHNLLFHAVLHGRPRPQLEHIVGLGCEWNLTDIKGNSILHVAVNHGHVEALDYFLSLGAIVNARNNQDETPLHRIVFTERNFDEIVTLLVENRVDVEATNINGHNVFQRMIESGQSPQKLMERIMRIVRRHL